MRDSNAWQRVIFYGGEGTKPEPAKPKPVTDPVPEPAPPPMEPGSGPLDPATPGGKA